MMLKRSRLTKAEVQSQCLQVERANIKSNAIYKKGVTTQRVYKVKQRCRTILRA